MLERQCPLLTLLVDLRKCFWGSILQTHPGAVQLDVGDGVWGDGPDCQQFAVHSSRDSLVF